jgi:integrase
MIIFSGVRSQEPREAKWKEIDWSNELWEVPPEHLKMGKKHGKQRPIPLTKPMLDVLKQMQARRLNPSDNEALIFPPPQSPDGTKAFNDAMLSKLTRDLKWEKDVTPHGFRFTLKDWAAANNWPPELVERQHDHKPKSETEASIRYSDLVRIEAKDRSMPERRKMMDAYARFCDPAAYADDNVVQFQA